MSIHSARSPACCMIIVMSRSTWTEDLRRGGAMTPVEGLVAARRALTLTSVVAIL